MALAEQLFKTDVEQKIPTGWEINEFKGNLIPTQVVEQIQKARESYFRAWGGSEALNKELSWDEIDGREATHHFIARLPDSSVITMRATEIFAHELEDASKLPIDLTGWTVELNDSKIPLLDIIKTRYRLFPPSSHILTVISRGASTSNGNRPEFFRDMTAAAFADINQRVARQSLEADIICELQPALQNTIFAIQHQGQNHTLDFIPTANSIGLPEGAKAVLNRQSLTIQDLIRFYPGYWSNYSDTICVVEQLLNENSPASVDLQTQLSQALGTRVTTENLRSLLSGPTKMKALIPLLSKPNNQLFDQILNQSGDGPFSALIPGESWLESCRHMLDIYEQKYRIPTMSRKLEKSIPAPEQQEVKLREPYTSDDLRILLTPSKDENHHLLLSEYLKAKQPQEIDLLEAGYQSQVEELRKLEAVNDQAPMNLEGQETWVVDPVSKEVKKILSREAYLRVLQSRLFPLFSAHELVTIADSKILMLGCSTGRSTAINLAQFGVGQIIFSDPDNYELSNLSRIPGQGIYELMQNKAIATAKHALSINPYMKVEVYPFAMTDPELHSAVQQADLVVEMIDGSAKENVRHIAAKHGKSVFMPTNVEWSPFVTITRPGDPIPDFSGGIADVVKIIGPENLPIRQMLNFELVALGKLRHLSQHGANASGAAYLGTMVIIKERLGIPQPSIVKLDGPAISNENPEDIARRDAVFMGELKEAYPDIFEEFDTLLQAVSSLSQRLFGIQYPPTPLPHN